MKRELIPVKFEGVLAETLDTLVGMGIYSTKSEAIRDGVRLLEEKYGIRTSPASYFRNEVQRLITKSRKKYSKEELEKKMGEASRKAWQEWKKRA